MARTQKLKVYRTPIGFHDAYVAAPSQKAALKAWGSDVDLFARGAAEEVRDEALTGEPLERPGEVIRRSRGSKAEQLAALPPDRPKRRPPPLEDDAPASAPRRHSAKRPTAEKTAPSPRRRIAVKPKPRPSRAKLDQAEEALATLQEQQRAEDEALRQREREIARERRDLGRRHGRDRARAESDVEREREAHSAALSRWRETQV